MKLYEVKSRLNRPVTVQMLEPVAGIDGLSVTRTVATKDPKSEEFRQVDKVIDCPAVVTFPARGRVSVPEAVINNPTVKSYLRRRDFRIVKTHG